MSDVEENLKRIKAQLETATNETGDKVGKVLENPGQDLYFNGNLDSMRETLTGLSQVGVMTGQNMYQTGQQQQDYYKSLQNRRNGDDSVAANMMAGRNRNLANVGRQFAGRGVSGGVAAAGMNSATNTADMGINEQKQKNATSNDKELWNYVKRNQKVTGEALSQGEDKGLAANMNTSGADGMFGTIICTELHRQGLMSDEVLRADIEAGQDIRAHMPAVMEGYLFLAAPIVRQMRKSKKFTKAVAFFALPWAKTMAGESHLRGDLLIVFGLPLCFAVGLCLPRKLARA